MKIDAEYFSRFTRTCATLLRVDLDVIQDSLLYLQGRRQTWSAYELAAHRLAANITQLQRGQPVHPWSVQKKNEWVTVQITGATPRLSNSMEAGALLQLKFMTGTVAGLTIKKWHSLRTCRGLSRKVCFPRPKSDKHWDPPKWLYRIPEDLVTLRFEAQISREYCTEDPGYREFRKDKEASAWNNEQLRYRYRTDGYSCPKHFERSVFCHNCPASLKQCRAATRPEALALINCTKCKKKKWGYSEKQSICIGCLREEAYRYHNTKIEKETRGKINLEVVEGDS